MSCEICGKTSCSKSFHSIDEQSQHEEIIEQAISNLKQKLINKINRSAFWMDNEEGEEKEVLNLNDVINIIEDE